VVFTRGASRLIETRVLRIIRRNEVWVQYRRDYKKRRAAVLVRNKAWRKANPERAMQYRRDYYLRNRERMINQAKAWQKANPEKRKEYVRRWREKKRYKRERETPNES
jgi:hypothetical protein